MHFYGPITQRLGPDPAKWEQIPHDTLDDVVHLLEGCRDLTK